MEGAIIDPIKAQYSRKTCLVYSELSYWKIISGAIQKVFLTVKVANPTRVKKIG